jgi:phenylalanyl-tRNA synthetase beta subunit
LSAPKKDKRYSAISKFQESYFDISLMLPLAKTADSLKKAVTKLDKYITNVELLDFFEKEEWPDARSLTFRIWACSDEKTLEKNDIDNLRKKVIACFETLDAKVRA